MRALRTAGAALMTGAALFAAAPAFAAVTGVGVTLDRSTVAPGGSVNVIASCDSTRSVFDGTVGGRSISFSPGSMGSGGFNTSNGTATAPMAAGKYAVMVGCSGGPGGAARITGTAWLTVGGKGGMRTGDGASQASTTGDLALGGTLAVGGAALGAAALRRRKAGSAA